MVPISVVIITLNEEKNLAALLPKLTTLTDDIVIVDSGSTDNTVAIAEQLGARVIYRQWAGYAKAKNEGNKEARYNWILSLDADEFPDGTLLGNLYTIGLNDPYIAYDISFQLYFQHKPINHGNWGHVHHIRLFNRMVIKWDEVPVHEDVTVPDEAAIVRVKGHIHHYSVATLEQFILKTNNYAKLNAIKYFNSGQKATISKLYLSPLFNFLKNYILRLGFLDGYEGWVIARTQVWYTWYKYYCLKNMYPQKSLYLDTADQAITTRLQ